MWNVFDGVKILIVCRNFDAAFPTRGAVEVQSARIVECSAVHCQMVIMEPFIHWPCGRATPNVVITFRERCAASSAQPQADLNTLSVGGGDAKAHVSLRIDLRI